MLNKGQYCLPRGWFAVRNLTPEERIDERLNKARDTKESKYFLTDFKRKFKAASVRHNQFGIHNLRDCLGGVLYQQVKMVFPDLSQRLKESRKTISEQLEDLGEPRNTTQLQRAHLYRLQRKYQALASNLLSGVTVNESEIADSSMLLRPIHELNDGFAHQIRWKACKHTVDLGNALTLRETRSALPMRRSTIRLCTDGLWDKSRGIEERHDYPLFLKRDLFLAQALHWSVEANQYLENVIEHFRTCSDQIHKEACSDSDIRCKVVDALDRLETASIKQAQQELGAIVRDLSKQPETYHHDYEDQLKSARQQRLEKIAVAKQQIVSGEVQTQTLEDLEHDAKLFELHDWLICYLKVAVPRFIDNVVTQVVHRHLLGPRGPLRVFDADFVDNLTAPELEDLVGEDEKTKIKREKLSEQIEALDKAITEAQRLARR